MFQYGVATVLSRPTLRAAFVAALAILSAVRPAWSQTRTAALAVTVVDQTGAVIGGATVTVTGTDDAKLPARRRPVGVGRRRHPARLSGFTVADDFPASTTP